MGQPFPMPKRARTGGLFGHLQLALCSLYVECLEVSVHEERRVPALLVLLGLGIQCCHPLVPFVGLVAVELLLCAPVIVRQVPLEHDLRAERVLAPGTDDLATMARLVRKDQGRTRLRLDRDEGAIVLEEVRGNLKGGLATLEILVEVDQHGEYARKVLPGYPWAIHVGHELLPLGVPCDLEHVVEASWLPMPRVAEPHGPATVAELFHAMRQHSCPKGLRKLRGTPKYTVRGPILLRVLPSRGRETDALGCSNDLLALLLGEHVAHTETGMAEARLQVRHTSQGLLTAPLPRLREQLLEEF
mmetsp:Transcript_44298/g.123187  ORF Transcript_44298/g.123187 Transcript_44298/m.123187 type:complete len:302 (-) Transcript_44298:739-1644(-)